MQKLSNGFTYSNEHFHVVFGEYLLANDYRVIDQGKAILFDNGFRRLFIKGNNMDLFVLDTVKDPELPWQYAQSHTGFGHLDLHSFIMLLHVMDVVVMREFLNTAKGKDKQLYTEAKSILKDLVTLNIPALS